MANPSYDNLKNVINHSSLKSHFITDRKWGQVVMKSPEGHQVTASVHPRDIMFTKFYFKEKNHVCNYVSLICPLLRLFWQIGCQLYWQILFFEFHSGMAYPCPLLPAKNRSLNEKERHHQERYTASKKDGRRLLLILTFSPTE